MPALSLKCIPKATGRVLIKTKMKVSQDQQKALKKIISWYQNLQKEKQQRLQKNLPPLRDQYVTLGGYAGTGKTTLISVFRHILYKISPQLKVGFISYTGKATRILKNKLQENQAIFGDDSVTTIHSLIYSPLTNNKEEIIGWQIKDEIDKDFLIIDEASMVTREIWQDLQAYKKPILAVGDHGQLPPIGGNFNLMQNPDVKLTKIHRQARGNPIIEVATLAREKGEIPVKKYGKGIMKMDRTSWETQETVTQLLEEYDENTIILCGYNNTRVRINQQIRGFLGYHTPHPEVGDRVICLRNNHEKGIFNGMLGQIKHIEPHNKKWLFARIEMEDGFDFEGLILKEQFNAKEALNFSKRRRETLEGDLFDFGYAMTVHKAQGSQAKRVILFEERFKQMDDEAWRRWLYTGVTRAEEELFVIGDSQPLNKQNKVL
ncbi:AAA family ATPase [candidate division WWE3 bacterium]|nr:AAA family ATPase [candidate division WWE3 bacterium]